MTYPSLLRTWAACLIGCLPLLVLLLIPQLMRSRAGSGALLGLGMTLLLVLLVGAFVVAPALSAWLAPVPRRWTPSTALRSAGALWRTRTGSAVGALALAVVIYAAGQAAGYGLAELAPYVSDNPAHLSDPTAPAWIIHYPAFALQAFVLYLTTTAAVAFYAWRIRGLHLARSHDDADARRR